MSDFENEETKVVYRNNFFGTLITLIIGLLLGIILTVGGVIAAGYAALSQPLGDTVTTVDGLAHTNIYGTLFGTDGNEGILSDSYASKTVNDLIGKVTSAAKGLTEDGGSLQALDEISPKVGDTLESLVETLAKYGIVLDTQTLLEKPLKSSNANQQTLLQYFTSSIQNASIGDLLSNFSDEPLSDLMLVLCYGAEGVDYTIDQDGNITMLGDSKKTTLSDLISGDMVSLLASVPVDAVIDINLEDDIMCAIAYGTADRVYLDEDGKAKMKQVSYTAKNGVFYTDKNEEVAASYNFLSATLIELTFSDRVEYAALDNGTWFVYKDEALTLPLLYEKVKIGDLQGDALAIIDNVYLKDALGVTNANDAHNVLISLAYGEFGVDYTVAADGTIVPINNPRTIGALRLRGGDLINDIALSDIVNEDRDQAIVMYLLYGKENIHYEIAADNSVKMLQKRIAVLNDKAYNEYGESISGTLDTANKTFVDAKGVTYKYGGESIGTVTTKNGEATLYYLTDEKGNKVSYKKATLGDMTGSDNVISNIVTRLTIGEIIEIGDGEHSLLKHVKNETIESLPTAIERLTIQQVFEAEIYKTDSDGNYLTDASGNKILEGSWWYLLHDEASCKANGHTASSCNCTNDYTIQEMDALIENMKNNIHLSTLEKLSSDGMLSFGDGMLNSRIITDITVANNTFHVKVRVPDENGNFPANADTLAADAFAGKNRLGELTVEEMIEYAEGLLKIVEQIDGFGTI